MHRNTFAIILVLSIIAALLIGINIGRRFSLFTPSPTPSAAATSTPQPTPSPKPPAVLATFPPTTLLQTYTNTTCGYSLKIPESWTYEELDALTSTFTNGNDNQEKINVICQKDIPRPPLQLEKIEDVLLSASISAKLYHDATAKDGTPLDAVITKVPGKDYDIILSGYGSTFNAIVQSFAFK